MTVLILSQKIADEYVQVLKSALPPDCELRIFTGSVLDHYEYIKTPAHDAGSIVSRLLSWLRYYRFMMKWAKANADINVDLIYATSNPPINGYLGTKLKKKFNAKFVYMNWDLYPQVIETSMRVPIAKAVSLYWNRKNQKIFSSIDQVLTIGEVMRNTINKSLRKKAPIAVVPMFTDTQQMKPIEKTYNQFSMENGLNDKFVVLFSGKMGLGHNIEILLEASKLLREYRDIVFLLIGHGQKYSMIERWISDENADNVMLLPLQPRDIFPQSMATGDVGFITQEKKAAKCFMPAKTYDMMACGMALIAVSEGTDDLSNLIKKYNMGIVLTEDDPKFLADAIARLYRNSEERARYGQNARKAAESEFSIEPIIAKYRMVFNAVLHGKSLGR